MMHLYFMRTPSTSGHLLSLMLMTLLSVLWPTASLLADTCASAGTIQLPSPVNLTREERAWLAALPIQQIGLTPNAAPLVGRDPSTGSYNGISIDVFCFIAGQLGLHYQLLEYRKDFLPYLQAIEQGKLDMLMPVSHQHDRESFGLFTLPYFTSYYALISRKGQPYTLESLSNRPNFKIGVIDQTALARDLAAQLPANNLRLFPLIDGKDVLYNALRSGEIDALVMNKEVFSEDRYRDEMFDMEVSQILTQFPRNYGFYFSRSEDHQRLVALFNRYLERIDTAGIALRHEVGEDLLIERYLLQQEYVTRQQVLMLISALLLLLLLAYIRHYRRLSKQLKASHQQVLEQQKALLEANQQLERMSMTDGLTGLANRRRFDERIALEFALHSRTGRPLSVLMLDLDYFKQVNDQLGHAIGDEYLRQVAHRLMQFCRRPSDLLARYGGEEIICLLPETAQPEAAQIAENMREAIANLQLANPSAPEGTLTLSIGVATQGAQHASTTDLLAEVDARLYKAKRAGRNQVCAVEQRIAQSIS